MVIGHCRKERQEKVLGCGGELDPVDGDLFLSKYGEVNVQGKGN